MFLCSRRFYCGCRFTFSAGIGQKPAGQASGEPARYAAAARGSGWKIAGSARRDFFDSALLFVGFVFNTGERRGSNGRLTAIFRQRFAGKNDLILGDAWSGRRCAARSLRTAIVVVTRLSAAIVVTAGLATLRGSVFRRRQIASASWAARARATLGAPAAMTSATPSPTATTSAVTTAISASIAVAAAAKILAGTVVAATSGIVLCGIVMGCKILRRGSVGIRLAFLGRFSVLVLDGSGLNFVVVLL